MRDFKKGIAQLYIFSLLNILLVFVVAISYAQHIDGLDDFWAILYFLITTFSHFVLIGLLPFFISIFIFFLTKSKKFTFVFYSILAVLLLIILKIDSQIFDQFRYHLSPIVLELLFGKRANDIFQFSYGDIFYFGAIIFFIISIQFLFYYISKKAISKIKLFYFKYQIIAFSICFLLSHLMFAWADVNFYRPIVQFKNVYPLFYPLTAEKLMTNVGLVDKDFIAKNNKLNQNYSGNIIQYPLSIIESFPLEKTKNIILIVIDSWRYDCLTEEITPTLFEIAQQSQVFENHYSGSNMTTGGIFSLFYGIPATYYDSFTNYQKSPVLIDELLKQNYSMGIFSSSTLENPTFNKNVFCHIKNLRNFSDGNSPSERDCDVTSDCLAFLKNRNKEKPFFSFLFYDAAHGFDYPDSFETPFKPSIKNVNYLDLNDDYNALPLKNRFKNSLNFIDHEIEKIIEALKDEGELENSLIVITGDHGQEFNDNKKGYWQHGGNFSKHQIKVPFLLFDPSLEAKKHSHLSLHYDVVPTIMKNYLGVKNDLNDYSTGKILFENSNRDWFVCGYNQKYAVIQKNKITTIYASGFFEVTDQNLKILNEEINFSIIEKALKETHKFYKKK